MLSDEFKEGLTKTIHTSLDVGGAWFNSAKDYCSEYLVDFNDDEVGEAIIKAIDEYSKIAKAIKADIDKDII